MKCFLIEQATGSTEIQLSASWPGCSKDPYGEGKHRGRHIAFLSDEAEAQAKWDSQNRLDEQVHFVCENCGEDGGIRRATGSGMGTSWKRLDTGEIKRHTHNFGPGAMWFATWYALEKKGPNGETLYGYDWDNQTTPPLIVTTPSGGDWNIDSRASNCTMPNDRLHRCWVRHGDPPNVTVDKAGHTCGAGAGSIISRDYHGFLRNGQFT